MSRPRASMRGAADCARRPTRMAPRRLRQAVEEGRQVREAAPQLGGGDADGAVPGRDHVPYNRRLARQASLLGERLDRAGGGVGAVTCDDAEARGVGAGLLHEDQDAGGGAAVEGVGRGDGEGEGGAEVGEVGGETQALSLLNAHLYTGIATSVSSLLTNHFSSLPLERISSLSLASALADSKRNFLFSLVTYQSSNRFSIISISNCDSSGSTGTMTLISFSMCAPILPTLRMASIASTLSSDTSRGALPSAIILFS